MVIPSPLISIFHSFLLLPLSCPKLQSPSLSSPTPQVFLFPFPILLHLPKTSYPSISLATIMFILFFLFPSFPNFYPSTYHEFLHSSFSFPFPFLPTHLFSSQPPTHIPAPLPYLPLKRLPIQPIYSYSLLFFCQPSSSSSSSIHLLPSPLSFPFPPHSSVHPPSL